MLTSRTRTLSQILHLCLSIASSACQEWELPTKLAAQIREIYCRVHSRRLNRVLVCWPQSYNAKAERSGAINVGKAIMASKHISKRLAAACVGLSSVRTPSCREQHNTCSTRSMSVRQVAVMLVARNAASDGAAHVQEGSSGSSLVWSLTILAHRPHSADVDRCSALQLAVSPDGKYAFALVYGNSPAFYAEANLVVVDIHNSKRVRAACQSLMHALRIRLQLVATPLLWTA